MNKFEVFGDGNVKTVVYRTPANVLVAIKEGLTPYGAEKMCAKLNAGLRMSKCSMCGGTQPSDSTSHYFHAEPEQEFDSDWDGCERGAGT